MDLDGDEDIDGRNHRAAALLAELETDEPET